MRTNKEIDKGISLDWKPNFYPFDGTLTLEKVIGLVKKENPHIYLLFFYLFIKRVVSWLEIWHLVGYVIDMCYFFNFFYLPKN